jgi:hypothetical protein
MPADAALITSNPPRQSQRQPRGMRWRVVREYSKRHTRMNGIRAHAVGRRERGETRNDGFRKVPAALRYGCHALSRLLAALDAHMRQRVGPYIHNTIHSQ